MKFQDRADAGRQLAGLLGSYADEKPIVLGLARGGVPVAAEVARALDAPLEVMVVRKLGAPFQPELGIGAIAEGGVKYVNEALCHRFGICGADVEAVSAVEEREVARRIEVYRGGRALPDLADRTVIIVDDGVATGGSARAAIAAVRAHRPRRIVFAVPVAAAQTAEDLINRVDDLVAVEAPRDLRAIGQWYRDFRQVDDEEVSALLVRERTARAEDAHLQRGHALDDVRP